MFVYSFFSCIWKKILRKKFETRPTVLKEKNLPQLISMKYTLDIAP